MTTKRPKPQKLEWSGGILGDKSLGDVEKVPLKGQQKSPSPSPASSQASLGSDPTRPLKGPVRLRRETKGRAGKTVVVLFEFGDPLARSEERLKDLCTDLKNRFACGGTVEEGTLLLQTQDVEKVLKVLAAMGFVPKKSGG
jgi:translation initiation factor 1 (eIF-1/SUI1)